MDQILQGLSSSDNGVRSQAEDQLNNEWQQKQPDVLLMALVDSIQHSSEASVRLPGRPLCLSRWPSRLHYTICA